MNNVTIKTLAQALGLSAGTISKALKDSHEISAATKKRVIDIARKLHYVPNPYASSLRKRKSKTIGVVIPEVADSFFSLAINGIEAVAQEKGYHVLIYLTHEQFIKEEAILEDFKSGRVDGILISITRETDSSAHIQALQNNGIPVVFFDRVAEDMDATKVTTNDFESGYAAARHLIENGCSRIAYLSISSSLSITNKRMEGYEQALVDFSVGKSIVQFCSNELKDDFKTVKKLMAKKNRPDGVLVSVEKLAITVYHVCRDLHLSIPKQVKVVAFSNLVSAFLLDPPLTTITQPAFDIGKTAALLLFKTLEKRNLVAKENIVLPSVLTVRKSTALSN